MRLPLTVAAALAALVLTVLISGCGTSSPDPSTSVPVLSSLGPPAASAAVSATPRVIVLPTPGPTPHASLSEPPVARIAAGVTSAVDGVLGSWTLDGSVTEQAWIDLALLERTDFPADELVF
ncbi:MAG: hypothetical protein L0221_18055, partial [Chloroflexi bacterium]|nr:hypothetical protein [Chloroflexota bacterium]